MSGFVDHLLIGLLVVLIIVGTSYLCSRLRDEARALRPTYFVEILNGDGGYISCGKRGLLAIPKKYITAVYENGGKETRRII